MSTLLYHHPVCFDHNNGPYHPERPERLTALMEILKAPIFAALKHVEAPQASWSMLCRVHAKEHVRSLFDQIPSSGYVSLGDDTFLSPASGEAALRAAGAVCAAVDALCDGQADNAFCAVRPPGHHAEPSRSMGFCLVNSVAIAAAHAHEVRGLQRVAVIDFDVHHGNGTQAYAWDRSWLFFASSHQWPLYPGSGRIEERGAHDTILNLPLRPGTKGDALLSHFHQRLIPALEAFRPDILLVSAGYDGHQADPLAQWLLTKEDFCDIADLLVETAGRLCNGRLVLTLEGGYDVHALAESAAAQIEVLLAASS